MSVPMWLKITGQMIVSAWILNALVLNMAKTFGADPDSVWLTGPRWLVSELRPLYLPAAVLIVACHSLSGQLGGWNLFGDTMQFVNWFVFKDEGDDRWKRRRKRLATKVKALASGRLVAVPVGAP